MNVRGRAMLAAMRLCAAPLLVCVTIPFGACNRNATSEGSDTSATRTGIVHGTRIVAA